MGVETDWRMLAALIGSAWGDKHPITMRVPQDVEKDAAKFSKMLYREDDEHFNEVLRRAMSGRCYSCGAKVGTFLERYKHGVYICKECEGKA